MAQSKVTIIPVRDTKFNTKTVNFFFCDTLTEERASYNALIPLVLRRGTKKYPTAKAINIRCQELYDTGIYADVDKKGEVQVASFTVSVLENRYVKEEPALFQKAVDLLFEMITQPCMENDIFKQEYVEQEKENLCNLIASKINDKSFYANYRCMETMCATEPYSVDEMGKEDVVRSITSEGLYDYYKNVFLKKLPLAVYVTGNVSREDLDYVASCCEKIGLAAEAPDGLPKSGTILPVQGAVKEVTEPMRVIQGKLCLGFRTQTCANDPLYPALTTCNMILGGGIESKLFQNVREKESLAYYAYSRIDKFKGVMLVAAGIDVGNKEKAQKLILNQLEAIQQGDISEKEFNAAINSYLDAICQMKDKQRTQAEFFLGQTICGVQGDLDDLTAKMRQVTKEEVVQVAQRIGLDTVYFLTAMEEA